MSKMILYNDVKILIETLLKTDEYETVLLKTIDKISNGKNKSKNKKIEKYQIATLLDILKELEVDDDKKPIINLLIGRLESEQELLNKM